MSVDEDANVWDRLMAPPDPHAEAIEDPFQDAADADDVAGVDDYQAQLERDIATRVRSLEIEQLAKARFVAKLRGPAKPFDAGTVDEILNRGPVPEERVHELVPADAGTLIVAQRKTGKTTLEINLARSLITGEPFLGRFETRKLEGNVALLNYEVSGLTLAKWAHEHQVPAKRFFIVNLRGARNPFADTAELQRLAQLLRQHDTQALVVDPFGRAYTGDSQNDSGQVGAWLTQLDLFARHDVGATDLFLSAHAGWVGERTRGSTALEDWPDSIVTLTRDKNNDQLRFLRAEGRDVLVEEDQLHYDPATRSLTLTGTGSRAIVSKNAQLDELTGPALRLIRDQGPLSGNALDRLFSEAGLPHQKGDGAKVGAILHSRDLVTSASGRGGGTYFTATSPTSPNLPEGNPVDLPDLPIKGEVNKGSKKPANCPECGGAVAPGRTANGHTTCADCEGAPHD